MKEIFVRLDRCLACRSCQLACALEHSASKDMVTAITEAPLPRYRLHIVRADDRNIPLTCRQCDPAPCLDACIGGSIYRDDRSMVRQREERCIGCWTCMMVCPYGVVGRHKEQKIAVKCDQCPDLDVPACVKACPSKALVYAEAEEFGAGVRRTIAGIVAEAVGK